MRAMTQTAAVGTLKPATAALLAGVGVVEAEAVVEAEETAEVAFIIAVEGRTEETGMDETMEAEGMALDIAVVTAVTKDWVTTGPVVPVRVKGAE
jgi:hypothetical protein